jgi:hypothetical protein
MTNKWKTFWELIFLGIISFPALHYLGISIHAINENVTLHDFNIASFIAPIVFLVIATFIAIFG